MFDIKDKDNYNRDEHLLDVLHRMTGFNIDTIEEYRVKSGVDLGKLKMDKIYSHDFKEKLFFIERRLKLLKIINKIK